jgi:hypothetical protein
MGAVTSAAQPGEDCGEGFLATCAADLRARSAGPLLLLAALALFLVESWQLQPQYDDAYISYRYARNWLAGHGLVFNPGEYVEGFSNPLWTLLVAGGLGLGASAVQAGHALGLASSALTLIASYAWARAGLSRATAGFAGIAVWVVLASPAFARWSISGMETPLFAATATGALAAAAWGRLGLATALALLASLTRPEGPLVAVAVLGLAWWAPASRRRAGLAIAAYAAAMALGVALRLAYYGDVVPNTFHAKVGSVDALRSAALAGVFLLENAGLLALPALWAVARDRRARPGAAFAIGLALYGASIGSVWRYLVPLVPCLAALGCLGAARLWQAGPPARALAAGTLAVSFACALLGLSGLRGLGEGDVFARAARIRGVAELRGEFAKAEALGRRRARILAERGERDVLVATGAIGSFGFYSGLPVLDILGLVDPVVARSRGGGRAEADALPGHQRSNPDYVLSREPDYILIAREVREGFGELVPAPEALRRHPDLARDYRWDARITGFRRIR